MTCLIVVVSQCFFNGAITVHTFLENCIKKIVRGLKNCHFLTAEAFYVLKEHPRTTANNLETKQQSTKRKRISFKKN